MILKFFVLLVFGYTESYFTIKKPDSCASVLSAHLISEIDNYQPVVNRIIDAAVNGSFKGRTWNELAEFVDDFGPRFTGTETLERAIDYVLDRSKTLGLENVHGEAAPVPRWIRGKESATLLSPRKKDLRMLGLGYSVGTPNDGITADAIVVKSFAELKRRADEVPGKIVVYNQDFVSYGKTVIYRSSGASKAAKLGAVATLIRSITPFSIYSPHTGMMDYEVNVTRIPAACITVEDAELLGRLAARGKTISILLKMEAHQLPNVESRNVIAEIVGSTKPNKTVVVSGHIDSWDVGQGAMDDGAGAFVSWNSLLLLKALNLRPKRTVRAIMWTAEEMGIVGADYYIKQHKHEEADLQFVMESDYGTFTPLGLEANGAPAVVCILQRIMKLLSVMTPLEVRTPGTGPDIEGWINAGVPGASLWNDAERYFWFHHSDGDTMTVEDTGNLDMITALFAATSYILADIGLDLPRHPPGLGTEFGR
ncbi:carboxypeptidase Q [Diachasma alloeum]|uniref:carboxypeptidase Q n=1 Tax=Diachasma alloeum TaxID=454923 RepID=UPI00073823EB|nr:carboxypeptidase Q [Diachasma alloeum]XP_015114108.1 carboxypeptidase Q [Diachasma alloeum]